MTGVSRTLLDLAAVLPAHQVERAANEAEIRGRIDQLSLADLLARYPRRRGIPTIRAILERIQTGTNVTRSELESRFLAFIREAGLPAPQLNVPLLGFECDCVWHDQRVIAELDGHATHATTTAFERDRARDRALAAAGWRTSGSHGASCNSMPRRWRWISQRFWARQDVDEEDEPASARTALPTAPRMRRCGAP